MIIESLLVLISVILSVAILTVNERHIMGALQNRTAPNKVGIYGLLQPFADGLKLILKETMIPLESNRIMFLMAPFQGFYLALISWSVIPFSENICLIEIRNGSLLLLIAISELAIYSVLLSGWSSNSKYPFLGGLRSTAQMISYSICLSIIFLSLCLSINSTNLLDYLSISENYHLAASLFPFFILFLVSAIAETNRAPMDLPEAYFRPL